MENETRVADERLSKFFKRLLDIKEYVRSQLENDDSEVLKEIYRRLDETIKQGK